MIRGIVKPIEKNYNIKTDIHNKFTVEVIDSRTGELKNTYQAKNVICDQLWSTYFLAGWNAYIHYGTGEGTPSASDTSLFNFYGYGALTNHSHDFNVKEHWFSFTRMYQLLETVAVGANISEVGIAAKSSADSLCTHAMLEDMNGNKISILKTDTDVINIYATVYVHWTPTNAAKILGLGKTQAYNRGWGCFAGISGSVWSLAVISKCVISEAFETHYPSGNVSASSKIDRENRTYTITFSRLGVNEHNNSGLHHIVLLTDEAKTESYPYKYSRYKPWIALNFPSDDVPAVPIVGESVATGDGVTQDFITKFPYAQNATVYVDGVPATNVTVNPDTFSPDYTLSDYIEEEAYDETRHNATLYSVTTGAGLSNRRSYSFAAGDCIVLYNPNYRIGLKSISYSSAKLQASNDLENWVDISGTAIPEEYCHHKYWKFVATNSMSISKFTQLDGYTSNNIHFDEPPAEGSVITIDYTTQCVPKSVDNVFDVSVTFSYGEYTEAQ